MTPALLAITLILGVTLCYVAVCAASPFGNCRKCNGLGFALTTDRKGKPKRGKTCRRCKGRRTTHWPSRRGSGIHRADVSPSRTSDC